MTVMIIFMTFFARAQHMVGEKWGGGIIFFLDPGGMHGLIAAESDLPEKYIWSVAKDECRKISSNGFKDWYLPNKEELNLLYLKREIVGGFTRDYYLSASEENDELIWVQSFASGYQFFNLRTYKMHARAIRRF